MQARTAGNTNAAQSSMNYQYTTAVGLLLAALWSAGTVGEPAPKRIAAVRTAAPIVLDGKLDDAAWQRAAAISDLHQVTPHEYAEPSEPTEYFITYDKDTIYIGGRFFDAQPDKITANTLKQGGVINTDDHMFVFLGPFNNARTGYFFLLNPNNVRRDGIIAETTRFNQDWDGIWDGRAVITDQGWTAELAIPVKTLSFYPDSDTWALNVSRDIARRTERMAWVSENRNLNPSAAGQIVGLTNLDTGLGLDVVPSMSVIDRKDFDANDREFVLEPALDVFYRLTPSLNGSMTINTDFSATEVDDRQVNLTRFSLFFPEKREFFLRDSDIFEFGRIGGRDPLSAISQVARENGRPFFSRTIGLTADDAPINLDFGGKLSGRIGEWNIGALAIRQPRVENISKTDVLVGRISRNIFRQSTIGIIATHGDPRSNLSNTLFGADFVYRNPTTQFGVFEAQAWYAQTATAGLKGDDGAWGMRLRLPNRDGFRAGAAVKEIQENYRPGLGFVSERAIRDYSGVIGYTWHPRDRYLQELFGGVETRRAQRLGGGTQSATTWLRLEMKNRSGDSLVLRYALFEEGLTAPFEVFPGVVIPIGDYDWDAYGFILQSAEHRRISTRLAVFQRGDFDGNRTRLQSAVKWRPSKHFNVEGSYLYDDWKTPFGNFISRLMTLKTSIIFSYTLSWDNLLQFDNQSNVFGINSRLVWIPKAGREIFLIVNHDLIERDDHFQSLSSETVFKINYTLRF